MTLPLISDPVQHDHRAVVSNANSISSNSVAFTNGRLYLIFVGGSGTTLRTVSSIGLTGVTGTITAFPIGQEDYNDGVFWATRGYSATDLSGTGTIDVTFSGNWGSHRYIHIFEITLGFDTSGLIVQSRNDEVLPNATTLEMDTFTNPPGSLHNLVVGYFVHRIQDAFTADNGGTVIEQQLSSPASVKGLWYKRGDATTTMRPKVTWATNTRGCIATGAEIKAAAVSPVASRWSSAGRLVTLDGRPV